VSELFHALRVLSTKEHIDGLAKSISFDVPAHLKGLFTWRAGQHLSIRFNLNNEEVRRSYSISSSPVSGDPIRITVKRVKDGLVSNYINDHITIGDSIDVMPPFGSFCLDTAQNDRRTHYFFGAGSGITPLYSMLHSVLCHEPHSGVYLAYGNKEAKSILFKEQLAGFMELYNQRFNVSHILSSPSIFDKFDYWRKGIIDESAIESFIKKHPPYAQDAQYYICGPGAMNSTVKAALNNLDVPNDRIHIESYGAAVTVDDTIKGIAATALIKLNGKTHEVAINENQTILEAVLESDLTPPFSCQAGVCGACRAQCQDGNVHMRTSMALNDADIENATILTCQSVATSTKLTIAYD